MRDVESGAKRYQTEVARRIALKADFFLEKKLREMAGLALDILESDGKRESVDTIVERFIARHPDFLELAISSPGEGGTDEYGISPVTSFAGQRAVVITAPVPYAERLIRATVDIGDIAQEIASERVGESGFAYAVDRVGNVAYHPYDGAVSKTLSVERPFMGLMGGVGTYVNEAGEETLGASMFAPGLGWTVVAERPLSAAWSDKRKAVHLAGLLMALGMLFTLALVSSFRKVMGIAKREERLGKAKSEYISLLAHQLRTPLSGTKWNLKTLLDGDWGPLTARQKRFLERSYETNEAMIALVRDLLDVTRIEDGKYGISPKRGDLSALVLRIADEHRAAAREAGVTLAVKKPKGRISTMIDEEKFGMALGNLIENAIRYNRSHGKVEVTVSKDGGMAKIAVSDTGAGIPAGQASKLFTKFFRGTNVMKMQVQGFGLGLYITKNIVEGHGGSIAVESKEGRGSTFTISLPMR